MSEKEITVKEIETKPKKKVILDKKNIYDK